MATLLPAISTCLPRMTAGERQLAKRLAQQLDNHCLVWYDVPLGPGQARPDFVVLHPQRGLLILETRQWEPETIRQATPQVWEMAYGERLKVTMNPLARARFCALQVVNALERDPQLVQTGGPRQGRLALPWGYGVVFSRITRQQFNAAGLGQAIAPHYVICQDEMLETADPQGFEQRLWRLCGDTVGGGAPFSPLQLDRVRWGLFAQLRLPPQGALCGASDAGAEIPGTVRVMDLRQEQLARSLGDGHRVVHGAAGSGKTVLLMHYADALARASTPESRPVLILCFSEPLAARLAATLEARGLAGKVQARHFHQWCEDQLVAAGLALPADHLPLVARLDETILRVIHAVQYRHIPTGQYQAVLVDEGHNFAPEWLQLVTQMVEPATNRLLLLYDDAQSIYDRSLTRHFSFQSVGIQAQGRTAVLKINYRNTRQILHTASRVAAGLLRADNQHDDGIPRVQPLDCGRDGEAPLVHRLPNLRAEAIKAAELLNAARHQGHAWSDMAVICRRYEDLDECAKALGRWKLPHQLRKGAGSFNPGDDSIKVMTMHACKGLEFAMVALVGVGQMPAEGDDEQEEARLFYGAATRATQRLVVMLSGDGKFAQQLMSEPLTA